ncbi:MAG: LacI family transcriptional regulator [Candidatus Symbiothrix sp.]|jgi:DNA-binding LacI/PurR family transcriptional regulator|nr:LacI family transcriptional regulator [Candidatus Symbiothrix sp.]
MNVKNNFDSIYAVIKEQILRQEFIHGSLLPAEQVVADKFSVSRPTVAKVYNRLQAEGFVKKKKGQGTMVIHDNAKLPRTIGLLLPGAGESEIFSVINDQILKLSESEEFICLWDGATANNAGIRKMLMESCCDSYISKKVDGILFSPLEREGNSHELNKRICDKIHAANIPVVLIDRDILPFPERSGFDIVCLDNFGAGRIMTQHLIDKGCKVINFFYRPDSAGSVDYRLAGVRETVLKNKLPFTDANIICGNPEDTEVVEEMRIMAGKTGIVCANDSTAAVLMSTIESLNIRISKDVLICGFDNMKYSKHLKRSLTTYEQPCVEIANIGIELIMRRIKNNHRPPVSVNLVGEKIERESTTFIS